MASSCPSRWTTSNAATSSTRSRHTGWNKSKTASILGIERSTLDRKIRRYQLDAVPPSA